MPSPALVSFLGVPGWGPLHLELAASADPPGLARRLRRARASAGLAGSPAVLLAAFLRQERDLQPLLRPWGYLPAGGRFRSHRFRICAGGEILSLRVTAWCWHGPGRGWLSCGRPLPLDRFVELLDPASPSIAAEEPSGPGGGLASRPGPVHSVAVLPKWIP